MRVRVVGVLAASLSLVASQGVFAADMPVKAPVFKAPAATAYDWTGFYLGGNVGVGVGRDFTRLDLPDPAALSFERSYLPTAASSAAKSATTGRYQTLSLAGPCSVSKATFNALVCVTISVA
jgi:hypothetical protein